MFKKIITISILIILSGISIPFLSNLEISQIRSILIGLGVILGVIASIFLYLKRPAYLLFLIPPAIIFGQVATIKIREWYYQVSLSEIIILLLFIYYTLEIIITKNFPKIRVPILLTTFLLYIFLSIVSLGWAENLSRAVIAIRNLGFDFLIIFLVINLTRNPKNLKIALFSLPFTGLLVSIQMLAKIYSLGGFQDTIDRQTIITPVGKWVYIAAIIILTLPLTYSLLLTTKTKWGKILLFISLIPSFIATFITLGKGEILSLTSGFIYLFTRQKIKKLTAIILVIIIFTIILIPLAAYAGKFVDRVTNTFNDPNTRFRIAEIYAAREIFLINPILGIGTGNLKLYYKDILPWSVESEANNLFLQVILELGIIGFAILILIIRQIYLELKDLKNLSLKTQDKLIYFGFAATLIIALINSMFEATMIGLYYGLIFWYILGLLLAQKELLKKS